MKTKKTDEIDSGTAPLTEYLPLVDESGKVIGKAPRDRCHGDPALMHPVVHLHVMNGRGRLLLQRRSEKKDLLPGFWDTAVGGHLAFGESVRDALIREAMEELGLDARDARFLYSYRWNGLAETELVSSFLLENAGPFRLDRNEVEETRFFKKNNIEDRLGKGIFTPNFEEEYRRLSDHGAI